MGKRKSKDNDDESIRQKIRKLEAQIRRKQRSRIRILESSSSEAEDNNAINVAADVEPPRSHAPDARVSRAGSPKPGSSRDAPPPPAAQQSPPPPPPRATSSVAGPSRAPDPPPRSASPVAGPSSAPDQIPGQSAVETPSNEDLELDDEILKLLGDAPKQISALGNPIHKDIANRWRDIL